MTGRQIILNSIYCLLIGAVMAAAFLLVEGEMSGLLYRTTRGGPSIRSVVSCVDAHGNALKCEIWTDYKGDVYLDDFTGQVEIRSKDLTNLPLFTARHYTPLIISGKPLN